MRRLFSQLSTGGFDKYIHWTYLDEFQNRQTAEQKKKD